MEELEFELGVEVGLQKLSSCFTATISIAGASYCIFIAKIINYVIRGAKLKKYFLKPQQELVFIGLFHETGVPYSSPLPDAFGIL
jgi:hypothetical protein